MFLGSTEIFDLIDGVTFTEVGYANGNILDPTDEDVRSQTSGYAETIKIEYDENKLFLSQILDAYYEIIDPTSLNRQGNDIGSSYRTGIYYADKNDFRIIKETISIVQSKYDEDIVVEVCPLENYYEAKGYHQKYLDKNPSGYCHIPQVKYDSINIKPMSEYEKLLRKEYHVPFDPYLRSLRKKRIVE